MRASRYLDQYEVVDEAGERLVFRDQCRFLVKDLWDAADARRT